MARPTLLECALDCEDAASGLHARYREALPRHAARITAVVSEFFGLSSALREISNAEGSRTYGPSFYRIVDDLDLVRRSLRLTTQDVFEMFARAHQHPEQTVWEDLEHKLAADERCGLLERLRLYKECLDAQSDVLKGSNAIDLSALRTNVMRLLERQERSQGLGPSSSGSTTPRPRRPSLRPPRPQSPSSESVLSEDLHFPRPPNMYAPDPPLHPAQVSPIYSNFSSGSSQTMSSQTSYSSDPYFGGPTISRSHWASDVFDGSCPRTRYKAEYQAVERSKCYGDVALDALEALESTGYQHAMQMAFDEDRLWVRLYYRPADARAIILVMTQDDYGQPLQYSEKLTKLKIVREGSLLKLCKVRRGSERHTMWARLNFILHERMVLFYNTFLAMKHQDQGGIAHRILVENFQLECEGGEKTLFAGEIRHGEMRHALRIIRDSASRVVRIEASALRGPRKDVPIWTAFVTRYAYDPDWVAYEGGGTVSLASFNPEPSVFISGYQPPVNRRGDPLLPFATDQDARMFMESWANLCRRYGR
ncbi:hypothetical protein Slin15195_G086820 [Septoria linicola]|uniref:Uncharacterized protein n=1 Tax=Septoria linicola TaxID=215465 RepID=A0A9Q9B0G9_9PEZI|nr:hypothetical protein Slin14017_G089410 [Septoria linicola]USW55363.1 hypothetical protein Slin15195_G086820 [Septoria linicola]